jgi:hypothetical protein
VFHENRSIARFGDGEVQLFFGKKDIVFQRNEPGIPELLREALLGKSSETIVAYCLRRMTNPVQIRAKSRLRKHVTGLSVRNSVITTNFRQSIFYSLNYLRLSREAGWPEISLIGEAEAFWLEAHPKAWDPSYRLSLLSDVRQWVRGKRILALAPKTPLRGAPMREVLSALRVADAEYIDIPETNAFSLAQEYAEYIAQRSDVSIVLLQAGPLATYLALKCGTLATQCVDLGSFNSTITLLNDELADEWPTGTAPRG